MADRKNRKLFPILLLILFGIGSLSIQLFFRWRSAKLEAAIEGASPENDLSQLRDLADRLAWYRPGDVDLLFLRAEYADRAGDNERAAELLASVPESAPEAPRARYLEALVHRNAYRLDDAERAFRTAVRLDPKFVDAHRGLTGLLGVEHRRADQVEALKGWIRSGIGTIEPLRLLGQSVVLIPPGTLDKTTDEGSILKRALDAQPESRHVRPPLARFLRNRGESAAAAELLNGWLKDHPQDSTARLEQFEGFVESGEEDEAERFARELGSSERSTPEFWMVLGDHKRNQERWAEAAVCYRKAIELDDRNPETYYRLAECLRSIGDVDGSARNLQIHSNLRDLAEIVAAVDPQRPSIASMIQAARKNAEAGRDFESRAWVREVLRLDRDNPDARAIMTGSEANRNAP